MTRLVMMKGCARLKCGKNVLTWALQTELKYSDN